ncbi:TraX family protein [Kluyvera ascorbata]|uniref:TraX family protein n=1 Tax=Kluyvera ascorbata TaxID=51288 RepID=UPI0034D41F0E
MNHTAPGLLHPLQRPGQLSPAAVDMVKVLALLAMLIDHINTLLLTQPSPLMYAAGRMAFPLFTLIWAMNVQHTPERLQKRASRMWAWAVITQPVFSLAFAGHQPWWALNILFVFAGVTQLLALQYRYGPKGLVSGVVLLAALAWPLMPASYGLPGLLLATGIVAAIGGKTPGVQCTGAIVSVLALCCLNGISHLLSQPADTLLFAMLPTVVLPLMVVSLSMQLCPDGCPRFMPRHFFYIAYAGHLLALLILMQLW